MKATAILSRPALRGALATVAKVVERRNTVPILSNVRLRAVGDGLDIIGTDLDLEVTARIPGAVDSGFDTTLPAHTLLDIEKKALASDSVAIDAPILLPVPEAPSGEAFEGEALDAWNEEYKRITAHNEAADGPASLDFEGLRVSMQALPASDFPTLGIEAPFKGNFVLNSGDLLRAIERTRFAISTEETRYYLNGIYMHVAIIEGVRSLVFVATDGHRLAKYRLSAPVGANEEMPGVIIPRKTVELLRGMLKGKGAPETVSVLVNTKKARFIVGNVTVVTKLIDGTFPDYCRVIPTGNDKRARFNVAALARAVEGVSVISSERGRAVKFSMKNGACTLSVTNPDAGTARMTVPYVDRASEPGWALDIGYNAQYVLAMCAAMSGEEMDIHFADPGSPALFLDPDDSAALYVQMPMRV